jgi:transcriptional regulator with XRE-family HTH domain
MITEQQLHENRRAIGQRITELRQSKGLTLEQLEQRTGLRFQNLYRIEKGLYNTGIDIYNKIAKALEVELKELF